MTSSYNLSTLATVMTNETMFVNSTTPTSRGGCHFPFLGPACVSAYVEVVRGEDLLWRFVYLLMGVILAAISGFRLPIAFIHGSKLQRVVTAFGLFSGCVLIVEALDPFGYHNVLPYTVTLLADSVVLASAYTAVFVGVPFWVSHMSEMFPTLRHPRGVRSTALILITSTWGTLLTGVFLVARDPQSSQATPKGVTVLILALMSLAGAIYLTAVFVLLYKRIVAIQALATAQPPILTPPRSSESSYHRLSFSDDMKVKYDSSTCSGSGPSTNSGTVGGLGKIDEEEMEHAWSPPAPTPSKSSGGCCQIFSWWSCMAAVERALLLGLLGFIAATVLQVYQGIRTLGNVDAPMAFTAWARYEHCLTTAAKPTLCSGDVDSNFMVIPAWAYLVFFQILLWKVEERTLEVPETPTVAVLKTPKSIADRSKSGKFGKSASVQSDDSRLYGSQVSSITSLYSMNHYSSTPSAPFSAASSSTDFASISAYVYGTPRAGTNENFVSLAPLSQTHRNLPTEPSSIV